MERWTDNSIALISVSCAFLPRVDPRVIRMGDATLVTGPVELVAGTGVRDLIEGPLDCCAF